LLVDSLANCLRRHARHLRKFVVLDCCFAGAAGRAFQGGQLDAALIQTRAAMPSHGTVLLCSSSGEKPSLIVNDATMFTGSVVKLLNNGHPNGPSFLSFQDLATYSYEYMRIEHGTKAIRPYCISPDQRDGDIGRLGIFVNPAARHTYQPTTIT